ncbi:sulfurtransferase complex subunit TusC [Motiliproteus coralliicola]|uniref:Sulfurtransferase complex subunit TusC n=1 Tax=Motiliproteus coralliicola TaxID=2283196 RepID=A0A369WYW6_9GAMM|nr:sulfurtransferase complex subunit TusC [Motiliproteus coralliicola]RDE24705.1 sulfurtransferase complex subunit TusC [Motiliproteus coralliicola]
MSQIADLLLVLRHGPYGGLNAREGLDAALTAAAFEVPLSLLFLNDGIYLLQSDQQPGQLPAKDLSKTVPALAMYDIERLYVRSRDLEQRGMKPEQLVVEVEVLDDEQAANLFHQHRHILSF